MCAEGKNGPKQNSRHVSAVLFGKITVQSASIAAIHKVRRLSQTKDGAPCVSTQAICPTALYQFGPEHRAEGAVAVRGSLACDSHFLRSLWHRRRCGRGERIGSASYTGSMALRSAGHIEGLLNSAAAHRGRDFCAAQRANCLSMGHNARKHPPNQAAFLRRTSIGPVLFPSMKNPALRSAGWVFGAMKYLPRKQKSFESTAPGAAFILR